MEVKCIKNLYKSTYNCNAFTNGTKYVLIHEDDDFYLLIDSFGCTFNFHKKDGTKIYYYFNDYFEEIHTDYKPKFSIKKKIKSFISKLFNKISV